MSLARPSRGSATVGLLSLALISLGPVGCGSSSGGYARPEPVTPAETQSLATLSLAGAGPQPAQDAAAPSPGRSIETRKLEQVEKRLNAVETELAELKPVIQRLVLVEYDIRVLLDKMEVIAHREPVDHGTGQNDDPASPVSGAQLMPLGSLAADPVTVGGGAEPPTNPATRRAAPLTIEPEPIPATMPAAVAERPAPGTFGLHLASYKRQADAARGWSILRARFQEELSGTEYGEQSVRLNGAKGQVLRLVAGPIAGRAKARSVCESLKRAGQYCSVVRL